MDDRSKATLFAVLAGVCAAATAVLAADPTTSHALLVLPPILMAVLLFISGYFGGLSRKDR